MFQTTAAETKTAVLPARRLPNLKEQYSMTQSPVATPPPPSPTPPTGGCVSCGREPGPGVSCQFCGQLAATPAGVRISSAGRRLGAHLLDGLLSSSPSESVGSSGR